jgi:hypothetical protein
VVHCAKFLNFSTWLSSCVKLSVQYVRWILLLYILQYLTDFMLVFILLCFVS